MFDRNIWWVENKVKFEKRAGATLRANAGCKHETFLRNVKPSFNLIYPPYAPLGHENFFNIMTYPLGDDPGPD